MKGPSDPNSQEHADDLALAAACAAGDETAIARLRGEHVNNALAGVRRLRGDNVRGEELEARLLEHLLVAAPGRAPRIASYTGRGSLRGFLQAAATRLMLTEIRSQRKEVGEPHEQASLALPPDLEAERDQRLPAVNTALRQAVTRLTVRNRNLLRQHYLDGLTTGQIARLYGVHRATAVRWLADAREAVLQSTRDAAIGMLGIKSNEVEGLFDLVRSRLDLSLSLFLRPQTPAPQTSNDEAPQNEEVSP